MTATALDLPSELLTAIFGATLTRRPRSLQHRLSVEDRATLAAFSLVHSSWTHPAQAILLSYVVLRGDITHGDSVNNLERDCCRRNRPAWTDRVRTIRFLASSSAAGDETGRASAAGAALPTRLLSLFPSNVALRFDSPCTIDWNALAALPGLRSLWFFSPFFLEEAPTNSFNPPTTPFRALEELAISVSALHQLLRASSPAVPIIADGLTERKPLFPALVALNLLAGKASGPVTPLHSASGASTPSDHQATANCMFPKLSALACPLSLKNEVASLHSLLPARLRQRILWHVGWQDFVDYMPPWRSFSSEHEPEPEREREARIHSDGGSTIMLRHLHLLPLPYEPIPPHFLDELTRRLDSDPSLHLLEGLWLPTKGWAALIRGGGLRATSETTSRIAFKDVLERKGVTLRWVENWAQDGDDSVKGGEIGMPMEYRIWASEQDERGQ
ncbi:hypothetical protein JCM10908_007036 [Rhodotorula pacifica]|uniref:uncharacterized protein n=1 Tax=Rhodotorula pacifica TaxID=1495444 RepID=UPI00317D4D9F